MKYKRNEHSLWAESIFFFLFLKEGEKGREGPPPIEPFSIA